MDRFVACYCDEDLTALVIDGRYSQAVLAKAWIQILTEYSELRGDNVADVEHWTLTKDVLRLSNHLFILERCINVLKDRWSESLAGSVRRLGYQFNPKSNIPGQYNEDLNKVINRSKTKYIQLQQLEKALHLQMAVVSDRKPKREYFENLLIQIEEMQKVSYTLDGITVQKFVLLEKKYWHQIELLKARAAKNGKY